MVCDAVNRLYLSCRVAALNVLRYSVNFSELFLFSIDATSDADLTLSFR